ncbi:hypothetical protein [Telmatospirillum sp.]|uniref:hypothetical protein n=1 Tax=Telmatospirillum sp. TaxID=2079197 RepID=UPI00284510A5|nr:hypothetical protein [Telmatospirillum sp.]MDR3440059.1 hypothetical protein [Telmatospirillum sp.]
MLRMFVAIVVAMAALAGAVPGAEAASVPVADLLDAQSDYTADFYVVSSKGRFQGSTVHAPGRGRWDFDASGGRQTLLLRRDTNEAAMLWPERKWYLSSSFQAVAGLIGGFDGVMVESKALGQERVGGEQTTRYEVSGDSGQGGSFHGRMWLSTDGIMMKLAGRVKFGGQESQIESGLSHVLRVKADPSAFVLPSDYKGLPLDFSKLSLH